MAAGELVEVSSLVDVTTVGVVRAVEVVDVVEVAETLGAAEVVVRGADVVELEGCAEVVVIGATVLEVGEVGVTGVADVVVEVSLASCSRSCSRLALASERARFAFSTCRPAKMRSFPLGASFTACSAFFNVASASATMRSPSSTVAGFGGATYSGATM